MPLAAQDVFDPMSIFFQPEQGEPPPEQPPLSHRVCAGLPAARPRKAR